jgi:4'-phosphopantetheinyl transferase
VRTPRSGGFLGGKHQLAARSCQHRGVVGGVYGSWVGGCGVWQVPLDRPVTARAAAALNAQERSRAARLLDPKRRQSFVNCRFALRSVIGAALGQEPADVSIVAGRSGKPETRPHRLWFSVAHSGDVGVIGLARCGPVGVDLERVETRRDHCALARRYFATSEADQICGLEPELARDAFLRCWTMKEAIVKASGFGLGGNLHRVVVEANPTRRLRLVSVPDGDADRDWSTCELSLCASRGRVAIAVRRADVPVAGVFDFERWSSVEARPAR